MLGNAEIVIRVNKNAEILGVPYPSKSFRLGDVSSPLLTPTKIVKTLQMAVHETLQMAVHETLQMAVHETLQTTVHETRYPKFT